MFLGQPLQKKNKYVKMRRGKEKKSKKRKMAWKQKIKKMKRNPQIKNQMKSRVNTEELQGKEYVLKFIKVQKMKMWSLRNTGGIRKGNMTKKNQYLIL